MQLSTKAGPFTLLLLSFPGGTTLCTFLPKIGVNFLHNTYLRVCCVEDSDGNGEHDPDASQDQRVEDACLLEETVKLLRKIPLSFTSHNEEISHC